MTDPQGHPDHESTAAPEPVKPAAPLPPAGSDRPAEPPVEPPVEPPAEPPVEPRAQPPAKKAAKKAPAKAAKKAPAKKAPAKKAPAKKAPANKAPGVVPAPATIPSPRPAGTNGSGRLAEGAKETAAQAKSMVEAARYPLAPAPLPSRRSPSPLLAAGILGLFGLLLIRRLLRARRG
ncbi:MAG: hypothetical protein ABI253_12410 [Mycobacterium sp.]